MCTLIFIIYPSNVNPNYSAESAVNVQCKLSFTVYSDLQHVSGDVHYCCTNYSTFIMQVNTKKFNRNIYQKDS